MRSVFRCECGHTFESRANPFGWRCNKCGGTAEPITTPTPPADAGYAPEDHDDHSSSTGFDDD